MVQLHQVEEHTANALLGGNCFQCITGGNNRAVDVRARVRCRNERRLKLRRRQENPAVQHFPEIPRVQFCVRLLRVTVVRHRLGRIEDR